MSDTHRVILPLNNIRLEATDNDGTDFIEGNVTIRLSTKIPRSLFDDPEALWDALAPVIAATKRATSDAYKQFPCIIGDRPVGRTPLEIREL